MSLKEFIAANRSELDANGCANRFGEGIMDTKLLPCPFCGEPAEKDLSRGFVSYQNKAENAVAVYCSKCPADMVMCYSDFPEYSAEQLFQILSEQWNQRKQ